MKTKRRIKLWLMCILTLLVSVFSILSDLIKFEGNIEVFTPWFWLNLILTNVSAVVIIFLSNSTEKDIQMLKNERYTTLFSSLFDLFKELNIRNLRTAFKRYIEEDNAREKREIYLGKLQRKIARCLHKIDVLEGRYNMWRLFFRKDTVDEPKTLRLLIWRRRLHFWESRLQTIDKDVKYVKIKYLKVTEHSIFCASDEKNRESRDMSCHTAEHNIEILAKKLLLVFMFGFAASLGFVFTPVVWSVDFIYKMAIRLFQIGMALYTGISDADKFVEGDMCDALSRRIIYVQGFKEQLLIK
jgi:hypothetical protein